MLSPRKHSTTPDRHKKNKWRSSKKLSLKSPRIGDCPSPPEGTSEKDEHSATGSEYNSLEGGAASPVLPVTLTPSTDSDQRILTPRSLNLPSSDDGPGLADDKNQGGSTERHSSFSLGSGSAPGTPSGSTKVTSPSMSTETRSSSKLIRTLSGFAGRSSIKKKRPQSINFDNRIIPGSARGGPEATTNSSTTSNQTHQTVPNLPIQKNSSLPLPKFSNTLTRDDLDRYRATEEEWAELPAMATAPFRFLPRDPTTAPEFIRKIANEQEKYMLKDTVSTLSSAQTPMSPADESAAFFALGTTGMIASGSMTMSGGAGGASTGPSGGGASTSTSSASASSTPMTATTASTSGSVAIGGVTSATVGSGSTGGIGGPAGLTSLTLPANTYESSTPASLKEARSTSPFSLRNLSPRGEKFKRWSSGMRPNDKQLVPASMGSPSDHPSSFGGSVIVAGSVGGNPVVGGSLPVGGSVIVSSTSPSNNMLNQAALLLSLGSAQPGSGTTSSGLPSASTVSPRFFPRWTDPPAFSSLSSENLSKVFPNWHIEMLQRVEMKKARIASRATDQRTAQAQPIRRRPPPPKRGTAAAASSTRKAFEQPDTETHSIVLQKFTECTEIERSFPQLKITINPLLLTRQRLASLRAKTEQRIREERRIEKQLRLESETLPTVESAIHL